MQIHCLGIGVLRVGAGRVSGFAFSILADLPPRPKKNAHRCSLQSGPVDYCTNPSVPTKPREFSPITYILLLQLGRHTEYSSVKRNTTIQSSQNNNNLIKRDDDGKRFPISHSNPAPAALGGRFPGAMPRVHSARARRLSNDFWPHISCCYC